MDQVPAPDHTAPVAMLAGELGFHDGVWLALCHLTLRSAGWRVVELGLDVPLETLERGFGRQHQGMLVLLQVPQSRADTVRLQRHVESQRGQLLCLAPGNDPRQLIEELLETAEERERRMLASVL